MTTRFTDRAEAGEQLAAALGDHYGSAIVIGLPRGGVPVAAEVARALNCPLDILMVRKLGVPAHPELGFGAIAEQGIRVLNDHMIEDLGITQHDIEAVTDREHAGLQRRVDTYRPGREVVSVQDRTVLLVDDGIATGFTVRAAIAALRLLGAGRVIVAAPVAAPDTVVELSGLADEVVVLSTPRHFVAVGRWYVDFTPVPDGEVARLLASFDSRVQPTPRSHVGSSIEAVDLPIGGVTLPGLLTIPPMEIGVVLFAHGSGSSRHSPRNMAVAERLNESGFVTLLFDLLTPDEASSRRNVFDIELLAGRLDAARRWIAERPELSGLPVGYFGASTGAAAALIAAAAPDADVAAVVSRGGRVDLAESWLPAVSAPTLMIVGGDDDVVLGLNRRVQPLFTHGADVEVVPGAGHLFQEDGAMEAVMLLTTDWFHRFLGASSESPAMY